MPKMTDWEIKSDVQDIMESFCTKFPRVFGHIVRDQIFVVHTLEKEDERKPIAVKPIKYPHDTLIDKVYFFVVADGTWNTMTKKQRNIAVFHAMCMIPEEAFDPESKFYARVRKPDYELFFEEYAVTGGVPDWMENESARDPADATQDNIQRKAVTVEAVSDA